MKFSNQFADFVNSGRRPTSDREVSALLDEARSVISNIVSRIESGEIAMAGPQAVASRPTAAAPVKPAPKATPSPKPTGHLAIYNALSGTAKREYLTKNAVAIQSEAKASSGTITAAAFAKPILTMERGQFAQLTSADKSRFSLAGGTLV
jgi:hypothetical protein